MTTVIQDKVFEGTGKVPPNVFTETCYVRGAGPHIDTALEKLNCFGLSNCDFTATFIYVEIQIMRPASAGLSGALAWMESLVKANARSPDLGRDLHQVLTTIL